MEEEEELSHHRPGDQGGASKAASGDAGRIDDYAATPAGGKSALDKVSELS